LYDHNKESYKKVKKSYEDGNDVVGIVHATGTGKTYNALQLAYDNQDKKIIYVVPSNGIIEHIKKIILDNPNLDLERDFPNLEFRTYQSFINMSQDEIEELDVDMLILDEFHHIGAPVWGARINKIIETHEDIQIFGMTAYTVRDRGTSFERDMANPDGDELFSGKIVSRYDLCDAMIDGVLPKPIYKSAYINLLGAESELEEKVLKMNSSTKEYQEYMGILSSVKKRIQEAPSISNIVKRNLKPNGKYIYFCPPGSVDGVNDMETIMNEAKNWFLEMGLTEDDIVFYQTTSEMGTKGKLNREAFYNDETLEGVNASNKLRIMFAINQYNEGIHAPNVDGVIMGRGTTSDIVYFEQLGRALSVRGDTKKKYLEYEKYSREELLKLCKQRDIKVLDTTEKEELIEKLIAPVIIDLTNNYEFIRELENNLKDRIKQIQIPGNSPKRIIKIRDASFDIEIENQDLFEMLKYVSDRLTMTWEDYYELAKAYYQEHGNLEIPQNFKTNNGKDYDENGLINLGAWVATQRRNTNPESERGQLLTKIEMQFGNILNRLPWEKMYEYAKTYYQEHGDLKVKRNFKTNNGKDYDANGKINLGHWIEHQRSKINPESEKGKLLSEIRMRFEKMFNRLTLTWDEMYNYAKLYYEYHGNLEIPSRFKTNNGKDYDANGKINLGSWIYQQRLTINPLSQKGQLLSQIGMRFENKKSKLTWEEMYNYAKLYYDYHGHLEVQVKFKTNDGYTEDKNGNINLGKWISVQRSNTNLESERGKLLSQIGMRFINKKNTLSWDEMYEYAKTYYHEYGNLEIPQKFKTNNGKDYDLKGAINLGSWISTQRRNANPESKRGILLSRIGMIWNVKSNKEQIKSICLENNIDFNINKKVLDHISVQELISKIAFLQENGISVTNLDGKLSEIFSMSNINMQVMYGISLEELIDKYYLKDMKRGM
ncbi:MAG: Helicase associated domain protein, partial [Bacilli bacterium]|nr:Helicase associated domain protein [Bacilli bacterium]